MTPYGIATDRSVKTYVVDAQANTQDISSESRQTTEENPTSVYKMDFVLYIKSIYPAVSGSANRCQHPAQQQGREITFHIVQIVWLIMHITFCCKDTLFILHTQTISMSFFVQPHQKGVSKWTLYIV